MSLSRVTRKAKRILARPESSGSNTAPHLEVPTGPIIHPHGLVVLVEGMEPIVDIVAIHGLNGHREKTWTADNNKHWLRDFLPNDIPNARIISWGYDANTHSTSGISCQYLYDHAQTLVADLSRKRALTNSSKRPIIFIAHSLGGIIVKSALIHSDAAREGALLEHRSIKTSTHGILFMGTPHQGGNGVQLGSVLVNVASIFVSADNHLLKHLERDSEWLQQQLGQYGPISREFITKFAYEEYETPLVFGRKIMVVPRASAVVPGQADGEPISMHADHINIVKFASNEDPSYIKVSEVLQIIVATASTNVRSRWETEERIKEALNNGHKSYAKFLVPYNENPDFVGRSDILEDLMQQFGYKQLQGSFKPRSRVSICGLGGIGKTQIAIALVYKLKSTDPTISIFWVHASSAERFRQAYSSIALEYKIPGCDDPKADILPLVKTWMEEKDRGRWLMVLDNADETETFFPTHCKEGSATDEPETGVYVGPYIPECNHGSILITTRNKQTALRLTRGKSPTEIPKMNDDEANQLLCATFEDNAIPIITTTQLSSRLENLPLALVQAASFIQENDIPIDRYIQLLDEGDSALVNRLSEPFEAIGRDSGTPHAVTATWIVSFEQIKRRHSLASEVLSFISLFDRQAIPKAFITSYCRSSWSGKQQASIAEEVIKSLGTLKAFSFITQALDGTYDMHRLVQLVTRKWLANENRSINVTQTAIKVLWGKYPYGCYETREICSKYLPHVKAILGHNSGDSQDVNLAKASIMHKAGSFFDYCGQWKDAERYNLQAVKARKSILGEEHPSTLMSIGNLTSVYRNQGRWKEAEELDIRVIETSKRVLGEEHPDTLTSITSLATTYSMQGQWKKAEELDIRVMEINKRVLGEEHPNTLISIGNLASIYRNQGRWKEAEELDIRVMEISKRVLGEEHPDTLMSISALAITYRSQGRWKEAEELDIRVIETSERVLGEEHPDTLTSIARLAITYRNQGRWKEAEELDIRVIETSERVLGEEHPDTLTSIASLAIIYRNQGRWKEAEELDIRVAETRKRASINY